MSFLAKILVTLTILSLPLYFLIRRNSTSIIEKRPITCIEGDGCGLGRPEGVAFSPEGDCIAVANAASNAISFYRHLGDSIYETVPFFTLENPQAQLNYPHDLSFTPDGSHLAVANSHSATITIYKKNPDSSDYYLAPIATLKGNLAKFEQFHAVKYSPIENILAVADVLTSAIAFYHYEGEQYDPYPYQIIRNPIDILNRPDGLAFTSDGELLAVTSHGNHSVLFYQRLSDAGGFYSAEPVEILQGKQTHFCYTHSLSFHPSNNYLAVSSAAGKKTLCIFKKISNSFPRYSSSPIQTFEIYNPETIHLQKQLPEEGGVKGVSFSPDGKQLGVCASDIAHLDRQILILNVKPLN